MWELSKNNRYRKTCNLFHLITQLKVESWDFFEFAIWNVEIRILRPVLG